MGTRVKTYTEKRFFEWHEDDVSVTLRAKSGSYGGGSEVFIIDSIKTRSAPSAGMTGEGQTDNMSKQTN